LDGGYNTAYFFDLKVIWEKHADVLQSKTDQLD